MSDTDDDIAAGRHIITQYGTYNEVQWSGVNTSGMRALCDKVIVLPDQSPEMIGSVYVPETARENVGAAATTGILVSVGPQAFAWDSHGLHRWDGPKPQPGDRVFFQKYAGQEHRGADDLMYRIMEYRSIGASLEVAPTTETGEAERGDA